jgi:hypothetical protein
VILVVALTFANAAMGVINARVVGESDCRHGLGGAAQRYCSICMCIECVLVSCCCQLAHSVVLHSHHQAGSREEGTNISQKNAYAAPCTAAVPLI